MKRFKLRTFMDFIHLILTNKQIVVIGEKDHAVNYMWDTRSKEDVVLLCRMVANAAESMLDDKLTVVE